ncbi:MAG: hypothetical protein K2Q20_14465, partial [Phycisphaerales bacterium]|nr:hypothetical protein [Phycisphaerales bacterium]
MPKPLRPRHRWRMLAIAATTAATLLMAAWVVSLRWTVLQTRDSTGGTTSVSGIQQGCAISYWVTNGPGWREPWTNSFERAGEVLWVPNWSFRPDGAGAVLIPLWFPTAA